MGLWNWLFGKKPKVHVGEMVWMTNAGFLAGVAEDLKLAVDAETVVILIYQFPEDRSEALRIAQFAEVAYSDWHPGVGGGDLEEILRKNVGRVLMVAASELPEPASLSPLEFSEHFDVDLLMLHDHPEDPNRKRVLDFALGTGMSWLMCVSSLEHPLLRRLMDERIRKTLESIVGGEDEPLEHSLLSKALARARQQLFELVPFPSPSASIEEWLSKNCPESFTSEP